MTILRMPHLKSVLLVVLLVSFIVDLVLGLEEANKTAVDLTKSMYGTAFDEIVVESSLTVRRKPPGIRNSTSSNQASRRPIKIRREIRPNLPRSVFDLGGEFSSAQAQAFAYSQKQQGGVPLNFGASSSGVAEQNIKRGTAAFSGNQQYQFGDREVNIDFGSGRRGGANIKFSKKPRN